MVEFVNSVIDVQPLDATSRTMRYLETVETLDPVIPARVNDLIALHSVVAVHFKNVRHPFLFDFHLSFNSVVFTRPFRLLDWESYLFYWVQVNFETVIIKPFQTQQ